MFYKVSNGGTLPKAPSSVNDCMILTAANNAPQSGKWCGVNGKTIIHGWRSNASSGIDVYIVLLKKNGTQAINTLSINDNQIWVTKKVFNSDVIAASFSYNGSLGTSNQIKIYLT
jgi:hypothetical protein